MVVKRAFLFIDIGNSSVKYLSDNNAGHFDTPEEFRTYIARAGIRKVFLSSVGRQITAYRRIAAELNIELVEAKVQDHFEGLELSYADVSAFGVDRWLSLLAVRRRFPNQNLCVVSVGTATTIDCVARDGQHVGGAIAPGLRLSAEALEANTARLPEVDLQFKGRLGIDTESSINFGIIMSALGLIGQAIATLELTNIKVIFTGGDADILKPWYKGDSTLVSNSVLEGLELFSTYNS